MMLLHLCFFLCLFIFIYLSVSHFTLPSSFFLHSISSAEHAELLEYNNIKPNLAKILALYLLLCATLQNNSITCPLQSLKHIFSLLDPQVYNKMALKNLGGMTAYTHRKTGSLGIYIEPFLLRVKHEPSTKLR